MKFNDTLVSIKYFGPMTIAKGFWHKLIKKLGILEYKFPEQQWKEIGFSSFLVSNVELDQIRELLKETSFFPVQEVLKSKKVLSELNNNTSATLKIADDISDNTFRYFFEKSVKLDNSDIWHRDPFNKKDWPQKHWSKLRFFSEELDDIKLVWEVNRFSWIYDLIRAYGLTGDPKYAVIFWRSFEDWLDKNQPNYGVNWVSGQECALRVMAWCFGLFSFLHEESTTQDRLEKIVLALAIHAQRIEGFISHAIRQKTNHAMTESAGLYTIGTLFPFFKEAGKWKGLGKGILEQQGLRQIYKDGSYIQHSMNYHRLMLHAYLWCLRLGELNNDNFSEQLKDRLCKATEFLFQMQDDSTGRVPNYGANDGALILPLNSCDYLDYRPIVQSMNYLLHQKRLFDSGPWDEDLLWLFGPKALDEEKENKHRVSSEFAVGGYYTLRQKDSWGMIRCHNYRDRVGHVDMLHFDLWADGVNLLRDCGSYKYFAPDEPEMEHYFKSIWAHNTTVIDDSSPLKMISRFISLPWPQAQTLHFRKEEDVTEFRGVSFAYDRSPWNVRHIRNIVSYDDKNEWYVIDHFKGTDVHKIDLKWHLPLRSKVMTQQNNTVVVRLINDWVLKIESECQLKVEILSESLRGGWESLYYNEKLPINTLNVIVKAQLPVQLKTTVWKA